MIFAIAFVAGVAEVVSWSFFPRDRLGMFRFLPFAVLIGPLLAATALSAPFARVLGLAVVRNWPLALLWLYMTIGGLWTRLTTGSPESFFTHSLSMTTF